MRVRVQVRFRIRVSFTARVRVRVSVRVRVCLVTGTVGEGRHPQSLSSISRHQNQKAGLNVGAPVHD